jgi:murein DD-endopeptidase MepM/ murein hydrolase activator NlpD
MRVDHALIILLLITSLFVPAISTHQREVELLDERVDTLISKNQRLEEENSHLSMRRAVRLRSEVRQETDWQSYRSPITRAVVTSRCGYRMDPLGGGSEGLHKGVDLVGKSGSPIRAALSGEVVEHWPAPDGYYSGHPVFGGLVVIETDGAYLLYGHMSRTRVKEGQSVEAGEVIGTMGSTGISTGAHLHLEVVVDPLEWLEER